jgi:hypothetical protein
MKNNAAELFDAPIAGENLTSDTKNYPWHRPPDLVDYDEVVDYMVGQIMDPKALNSMMAFVDSGFTITSLVSYAMLSNIGKGKFQIDVAILAAGPVARLIQILAEDAGLDYIMGVEDDFERMSPVMLKLAMGDDDIIPDDPAENTLEETPAEESGLMDGSVPLAPASDDEQNAILGYGDEQEEVV